MATRQQRPGPTGHVDRLRRPLVRDLGLLFLVTGIAYHLARRTGGAAASTGDDIFIVGMVSVVLFFVTGFGATRLLLPEGLRRYELLWILPIGACTSALAFTALGYAAVPFDVSMVVVALASLGVAVYSLRTRGWPERPELRGLEWPTYVALLLAFVALIPMLRSGFPTVVGEGSDAHLAAGTARFLQHNHPMSTDIDEPLDEMHLAWRSKAAIYYPFAAVARLSGYETFECLSVILALMGALAGVGVFLFARVALGAGLTVSVAAMGLVGINRMVLHTVMHPYYNQTWGWFTLFFALLLAYWAVRERSRAAGVLLAMFLTVGAFAYPLALPIPLVALAALLWQDRREHQVRGEPVVDLSVRLRVRALYKGPRSLVWMIPAGLVFAVPVRGVLEKTFRAAEVLMPGTSLRSWGGDLLGFYPEHYFLGLSIAPLWWLVAAILGVLMWMALRDRPRGLTIGLFAVVAFGVVAAAYLRPRDYGYYFHFKVLAFTVPVLVVCAVVGMEKLRERWMTYTLIALLTATVYTSAYREISVTYEQTSVPIQTLMDWSDELPGDARVRLDIPENEQLWGAYMLFKHPVCSLRPLLGTDYPHVPPGRVADYVVAMTRRAKPRDATGPAVFQSDRYTMYRLKPGLAELRVPERLAGPVGCSKRLVRTQTQI